MNIIELNSWDEFFQTIAFIKKEYGTFECEGREFHNQILYRGQANSELTLLTTLERLNETNWTVLSYMKVIHSILPQLESYLEHSWNIPTSWAEVMKIVIDKIKKGREPIPFYEYWAYLRHHGYPSPLLDWSASPYIAAYFAFEDHIHKDFVAIYAYIEMSEGHKFSFTDKPRITVQGPIVKTHKRHFMQQSWYTIAHLKQKNDHEFVNHESVFENPEKGQDALVKITIPFSERIKALKNLREYNINRYSLFQTEEALVQTLALQELELNDTL